MKEIEKLIADSRWQDIEEAPKGDEHFILIHQPEMMKPNMSVVFFDHDWGRDGWWMCCDGKNIELPLRGDPPSRFHPLPDDRLADVCAVLLEGLGKVVDTWNEGKNPYVDAAAMVFDAQAALQKANQIAKGDGGE